MTFKTTGMCDNCGKDIHPSAMKEYYTLNLYKYVRLEPGNYGPWHFCSTDCLTEWSIERLAKS